MTKPFDLKKAVIEIEAICAEYVSNEAESLRQWGGDKLADELILSVSTLFAARSVSIVHVWSGEPIESIKKRWQEAFEFEQKVTLRKITNKLGNPGEEKK